MNPKINKLENEIIKTQEKITEMQDRLKSLERQKTEMENTEIVALFRSLDMRPADLAAFIKGIPKGSDTSDSKDKAQDQYNFEKEEPHDQEYNIAE